MRILHAVHAFLPRSQAGVELYTAWLADAQAEHHEVAVLYASDDPHGDPESLRCGKRGRVQLFELAPLPRPLRFAETYASDKVARRLDAALDSFAPDVVHIQHLQNLSIGLVARCVERGIPVLMTVHDYWLTCANGGQRYHRDLGRCPPDDARRCGACAAHMSPVGLRARALYRIVHGRLAAGAGRSQADAVGPAGLAPPFRGSLAAMARLGRGAARVTRGMLGALDPVQPREIERRWAALRALGCAIAVFLVPSRHLHDDLLRFGLPAARLRHLPHGIPVERFRRHALPELARRFTFMGSLVPHKGVHVLLEAFRAMPARAELAVVGDLATQPAYSAALVGAARQTNVRFLGAVANADVPSLLAETDCLVVPSLWRENSPFVIHEAFAAGVPVVASRLGGSIELLEHGGGLLYDADDPGALRAALLEVATLPGRLRELGTSIPPVKALTAHVEELLSIYAGLLPTRQQAADAAIGSPAAE